ncbi:MAG: PIG-L deacetylase family protein [bacterium]
MRALKFCLLAWFCLAACAAARAAVVVIAPHPDDGEASCGGLIANAAAAGERVVILTMTGGELGIPGRGAAEARAIRAEEARRGAEALGAEAAFFGAVDGSLEVTAETVEKLKKMLTDFDPGVVLAPWPLDVHPDHQASGLLAWRVFHDKSFRFELYFYETSNMPHTKTFQFFPTHYVDVTDTMKLKQKALYEHKSQLPQAWFDMYRVIAGFRGYEADTGFAEAYLRARNYSSLGGRAPVVRKTLGD